jgi:hypothetical protein
MAKAILIPVNPWREFRTGPHGNIAAYREKINEQGAAFWQLIPPGNWVAAEFPHSEIRVGYLYDRSSRRVRYKVAISGIRPISEVPFEEYQQYGVGRYENQSEYDEDSELFYVFTVTEIQELDPPLSLSDFRKHNTEDPVKLVRNYCIVEDLLA